MKRINYPLTLNLGIVVLALLLINIYWTPVETPTVESSEYINNPTLIALDSIAENYMSEGWTTDAAYLIAGFEVDLYDESDTAEYALYRAYMED